MPITTPVSEQHRELEGITSPERNESYRSGTTKWASAPLDCLSLIFEAGLGYTLTGEEFHEATLFTTNGHDLCQYLLTITHICRWWRQVAIDTPRLWSILIFNEQTPLSKLRTWLDRSKAAPLCINLVQGFALSASTYIDTELVPLLLRHIDHWGRFICSSVHVRVLANILKALEGKEAPLLEKLYLSRSSMFESQKLAASKLFNGPQSMPKLVDVEIKLIPLDWSIRPFRNLRALSLTSGRYGNAKLEQFVALLQESPQLMKLELSGSPVRSDELTAVFNQSDPVSLPSLAILSISHHPNPNILTLTLRLIHAPNLEKLRLYRLEDNEQAYVDFSPTIEALGNGVLSSFERLETLELTRVSFRSKAAWYLFCSKLTHLRDMTLDRMDYWWIDSDFEGDMYRGLLSALLPPKDILRLAYTSDATTGVWRVRCPNLQKLHAFGCHRSTLETCKRRRSRIGYGIAQVTN